MYALSPSHALGLCTGCSAASSSLCSPLPLLPASCLWSLVSGCLLGQQRGPFPDLAESAPFAAMNVACQWLGVLLFVLLSTACPRRVQGLVQWEGCSVGGETQSWAPAVPFLTRVWPPHGEKATRGDLGCWSRKRGPSVASSQGARTWPHLGCATGCHGGPPGTRWRGSGTQLLRGGGPRAQALLTLTSAFRVEVEKAVGLGCQEADRKRALDGNDMVPHECGPRLYLTGPSGQHQEDPARP